MIMGEEACDVGLALCLGGGGGGRRRVDGKKRSRPAVQLDVLFPAAAEEERGESARRSGHRNREEEEDEEDGGGGGSRREGSRKKLRLTREQFSLLEESFRQNSTLNPVQKKELVDKSKLRARQVEVWFQNRRARTKLKKTEVDCELLRKFCDGLSDENRRLKKDLHELRTAKQMVTSPFHMMRLMTKTPAAVLMCPSCQRLLADEPVTAAAAADAKPPPPP